MKKFEMPIADVDRFDLADIISASGEEVTETTGDPQEGYNEAHGPDYVCRGEGYEVDFIPDDPMCFKA